MFDTLRHRRFLENAGDSLLHHVILPPRKQSALDKVKASAAKMTSVQVMDDSHPKSGSLVMKLSGLYHVLSNVAHDDDDVFYHHHHEQCWTRRGRGPRVYDVFYLFLQKQKIGAKVHIYL
jgi:hypothetical protein